MLGTRISQPEITNISKHGFWIFLGDEELLLSFADFPWFKGATIAQLCEVERPTENHLFWPLLDVDLAVESVRDPAAYPLIASVTSGQSDLRDRNEK